MTLALSTCKNQKGFTLIEVLISVALLGIIATVFIQILNSSILLRSKSDLQAEASAIAMSQIEVLKQRDVVPTVLTQTSVVNGFDVVTTLTDVTSTIDLSKTTLPQADTSAFANAPLNLSIGSNLSIIAARLGTGDYTLTSTANKVIRINISKVPETLNQVQYTLEYPTALGSRTIDLGSYNQLSAGNRLFRITRLPNLESKINFTVNDNTHEPLLFGIFDDSNQQISVSPIGSNTTLTVLKNLSEQGDTNTMTQQYYEILVTVSKKGQSYARLLSTWAVKGD